MKRKCFFFDGLDFLFRRIPLIALACCLVCGILLGQYYASCCDQTYYLLMRMAPSCRVSIVGLLSVTFLPFLISAFAVCFSHPELMLPICFCKGFLFSCCAFVVASVFGSAGWLISFMLQFSDACTLPLLCLFWIRHLSGGNDSISTDILLCAALVLIVGVFDYCVISPYLVTLLDF